MTTMSQDDINALLAGVDSGAGLPPAAVEASAAPAAPVGSPDMLPHDPLPDSQFSLDNPDWQLTEEEIDVLGEVGNVCMGAVATTMYMMLDRKCDITTPKVSVHTTQEVLAEYRTPFVVVAVEYVEGIDGRNMLMIKDHDAALITDLLLGGDGNVPEPVELSELHISAISEVMNQMIGASATAMSKMLNMPVNISPPESIHIAENDDVGQYLDQSTVVIKIEFSMEIEGLLKSQLLQLLPFSLCRSLVSKVKQVAISGDEPESSPLMYSPSPSQIQHAPAPAPQSQPPAGYPPQQYAPPQQYPPQQYPPQQYQQPYPPQQYQQPYYPPYEQPYPQQPVPQPGNLVDVRPMQFQSFDAGKGDQTLPVQGMDLVHDIPLQVTVELGKTKKTISEILEFGRGSVIVLDKSIGEAVEVLVNGKLIAKGEVVVIDDSYGVRITEILNR